MFRVVKFGRYVIVHAICHVSLNVRIKRKKKRITSRAWAACGLESLGLENIPHFLGNRAKVGQNHDAREAVSAILSFLK